LPCRALSVDPGKNSVSVYGLPLSALSDDGLQLDRVSNKVLPLMVAKSFLMAAATATFYFE
jgi:hypothetical protein